jgi:PAS domain S-box-containing protein
MNDQAAGENPCPEKVPTIHEQAAATASSPAPHAWSEEALQGMLLQLNELRSIVNRTPAVVFCWRVAPGWPVEFVSENVDQFGYTADDFISGRASWVALLDQEDFARVERETFRYIADGVTEFTQQYRLHTRSGEVRWIEDRNVIRRDPSGVATHVEAVLLDVTDRKRAEEARQETERRYHLISDSVTDVIWTAECVEPIDLFGQLSEEMGHAARRMLDSRVTHVSLSVKQLLGYTADEILQIRLEQIVAASSQAPILQLFCDELVADQFRLHTIQVNLIAKDGSLRHCEVTGASLRNKKNQLVGMIGVVRDLTERLAAERALAQSEARLRSLVEQMPDVAAILDERGQILFVNRLEPNTTIVGRNAIDMLTPECQGQARATLQRAFDVKATQTIVVQSRKSAWYECRLVPMLNDQLVQRVIAIARDITERHRAETLGRILHDLAVDLGAVSNLTEAATICLRAAMTASGMEAAEFYIANRDGGIDFVAAIGLSPEALKSKVHFEPGTPQASLVTNGEPIYAAAESLPNAAMRAFCRQERLTAVSMVPVLHKGRSVACLGVASRSLTEFPAWVCGLIESIASQIGGVIARIQAEEELEREQRLLKHLLELHERERRLVAYEIHDGFVQPLTGALMTFEGAQQRLPSHATEGMRDVFQNGLRLLRESIQEARQLISSLRPPILDDLGIVPAIDYLVCEARGRSTIEIDYDYKVQFARLTPPLETTIFRIVQESLTNALRYSRSDRVSVRLHQEGSCLQIEIEDRGVGFDLDRVDPNRFGLRGIQERARMFGGQATIDSKPGRGTCVRVELPLHEAILEDDESHGWPAP